MRRTFEYRLYLTSEQIRTLDEMLETCRRLYNAFLSERKGAWEDEQRSVSYAEQSRSLPLRKADNPYLQAVFSQVLQDVARRVDLAYQAFFRRVKAGETPGYPRFRGRGRYDSLTYKQWGTGVAIRDDHLFLSKVGLVKIKLHRPLIGTPKTCTIRRRADGWYACVSCGDVPANPLPETGQETGIDVGLEAFATLADGTRIANPRHLRQAERILKTAQRRVSRRKNGSARRREAIVLLAKAHQHVGNARRDFQRKVANDLVRQFDRIAVEKLQIKNLVQNHHLAKSISDASWGQFISILVNKAECAGRDVVLVNPRGTSQTCSGCGAIVVKPLSERRHVCDCGADLHRDHNAALNILSLGRMARTEPSGRTGVSPSEEPRSPRL